MPISNAAGAVAVLNATAHRGARCWAHDPESGRISPEAWKLERDGEPAPELTVFEAWAIARGLVAIGAYQPKVQRLKLEPA